MKMVAKFLIKIVELVDLFTSNQVGLIKCKTLKPVAHAQRAPQVLVLILYLVVPS
jgi:hypothetical protein